MSSAVTALGQCWNFLGSLQLLKVGLSKSFSKASIELSEVNAKAFLRR
jgi:hypothetical protein